MAHHNQVNQVQQKAAVQWTSVTHTRITLEKLQLLTHSCKSLASDGYVLQQLDEREIWRKTRCQNCGYRMKSYRPTVVYEYFDQQEDLITFRNTRSVGESQAEQQHALEVARAAASTMTQGHACLFHDGKTFKGQWQCCGGNLNTQGCCSNVNHVAGKVNELRAEWHFHKTPNAVQASTIPGINPASSGRAKRGRGSERYINMHSPRVPPALNSNGSIQSVRAVVALDCEMGTSRIGNTVLIRVSLIDFFTQETLVNSLVSPTVEMAHYNTRWSGVTFAAMRKAIQTRTAIRGTDAARNEVFKYVNSNTIVIVHGGRSDFVALRWIHPASKIIDTCILEAYDDKVKEMKWKKSLKDVCERRCGIQVQNAKLDNGRMAGHDSLEDAFATREIVCAWLMYIPDE